MSVLDHFDDYKAVKITVPLQGGESLSLECVLKKTSPPFMEGHFLPGQLPVGGLDLSGECQVAFETAGRPVSLKAKIDKVLGAEKLRLEAIEERKIDQQRSFFRVDVELSLKYGPLPAEGEDAVLKDFRGVANLSGGGAWLPLKEPFESGDKYQLHLILPSSPPSRVSCIVEVVRVTGEGTDNRGVALKFSEVDNEDQEEIVGFCFAEQRRQLRSRVRV